MYPLEWFKLKRGAISSIGKDVKELEISYIAGGDGKCLTGLENKLGVSKELYINLSNDSVILLTRNESTHPYIDLYINIKSSFICIFMCITTWMNLKNNYVV